VTTVKPDIYTYHDYRLFLKDWFAHLKATERDFSMRALARTSGLSESYLSMTLSGSRTITLVKLEKLSRFIGLDVAAQSYLGWLHTIVESTDEEERLGALKKLQRFRKYQAANSNEIETYEYLTNWHYVAIREMAALPEFNLDPKWIRSRLKEKIPLQEIRAAIDFLVEHKFIELDEKGHCKRPSKSVHGKTGVLKPALTQFHRKMLTQACDSIDSTPTEERNISAHTAAIPKSKVDRAKKILEEARSQIIALTEGAGPDANEVYHFAFLAFPLTKNNPGET